MTSILIKAKVDFNALCDQVLPGMQELMMDYAGRHKLGWSQVSSHRSHPRNGRNRAFGSRLLQMGGKKGIPQLRTYGSAHLCHSSNGIPVLPNAPSTQIVITEAIRVLHTVEASRDAILTQMQASPRLCRNILSCAKCPCIGDTLAPRLIAEIGDVRRFTASGLIATPARCAAVPVRQILRE